MTVDILFLAYRTWRRDSPEKASWGILDRRFWEITKSWSWPKFRNGLPSSDDILLCARSLRPKVSLKEEGNKKICTYSTLRSLQFPKFGICTSLFHFKSLKGDKINYFGQFGHILTKFWSLDMSGTNNQAHVIYWHGPIAAPQGSPFHLDLETRSTREQQKEA